MHRSIHRTIRVLLLAAGVAGVAACSGGPEPTDLTAESDDGGAPATSAGDAAARVSLELHVRNDRVQGHRVASVALLAHGSDVEAPPAAEDAAVLAVQERLESLGFWLGDPDGKEGNLTTQAVMAFQKANRLQPDGKAGPATLDALGAASRPIPERMVDGIEIDLDRQLLFVIADGGVRWVLNTSTGAADTPTARGDFTIDRHVDGVRHAPLGSLYRPAYFDGGTAIHGAASVPAYPASHGCARVSGAAMDMLWASSLVELGTPVRVV